jgi:hypothetical protein
MKLRGTYINLHHSHLITFSSVVLYNNHHRELYVITPLQTEFFKNYI